MTGRKCFQEIGMELLLCPLLILYKYPNEDGYRSQASKESSPKGPGFALTPEEATRRADSVSPVNAQHSTMSYHVVENMNRRTAEQGTAEYRSEKHFLILFKNFCCSKFLVRYSIFKIQNLKFYSVESPTGGPPEAKFHRAGLKSAILKGGIKES